MTLSQKSVLCITWYLWPGKRSSYTQLCQLSQFLYKDTETTMQSKATLFEIQNHSDSLHATAASTTRHLMFPSHCQGLSSQSQAPLSPSSHGETGSPQAWVLALCAGLAVTSGARNPHTEYLPTPQQPTQKIAGSQHFLWSESCCLRHIFNIPKSASTFNCPLEHGKLWNLELSTGIPSAINNWGSSNGNLRSSPVSPQF